MTQTRKMKEKKRKNLLNSLLLISVFFPFFPFSVRPNEKRGKKKKLPSLVCWAPRRMRKKQQTNKEEQMKDKWADIGETKGAAAKLMKRRKRSGSAPFASDARARSRRARKVSRLEQKKKLTWVQAPRLSSSSPTFFLHSSSSCVSHQSLRPRWLDLHLIQLVSGISAAAENSAHLSEAAPSLDPR